MTFLLRYLVLVPPEAAPRRRAEMIRELNPGAATGQRCVAA